MDKDAQTYLGFLDLKHIMRWVPSSSGAMNHSMHLPVDEPPPPSSTSLKSCVKPVKKDPRDLTSRPLRVCVRRHGNVANQTVIFYYYAMHEAYK